MRRSLLLGLPLVGLALTLSAETAPDRGLEIARETERRDSGFGDYVAEAQMILRSRAGDEHTLGFRMKGLEVTGDGDKTIAVIDNPPDMTGTAILTFAHGLEPDDQWLFLPALKRVKRIASKNKSGPFLGSEFAYEDLGSWLVEKYNYRYLRDEVIDGRDCFVVENVPAYPFSGYSRQEEWVDKARYQPNRIVFYDRKGQALKTMVFKDYRQYLGRYWRAHEMSIENHQTGKSTRLVWKSYRFRTGLTARDLEPSSLERAQ